MEHERDFLPATELARLTGVAVKTQYNVHSTGKGPLAPILTRLGGRLGAWRVDYDQFVSDQRRLSASIKQPAARA